MTAELQKFLTELEKLHNSSSADERVLDLMEQVVAVPGGLDILVERYSDSPEPMFVRSLSFLLGDAASSPARNIYPLIFHLIEHLRCKDDESTLLNVLAAILHQLIARLTWEPPSEPRLVLYPFLMHCLSQSVLVQRGAIAVLSALYIRGLLESIFDAPQLDSLRRELKRISELDNEYLKNSELVDLTNFYENEPN